VALRGDVPEAILVENPKEPKNPRGLKAEAGLVAGSKLLVY
jgi:hypothetical protein